MNMQLVDICENLLNEKLVQENAYSILHRLVFFISWDLNLDKDYTKEQLLKDLELSIKDEYVNSEVQT
jgi:hypothetical protein